jgi:hypothetical protein
MFTGAAVAYGVVAWFRTQLTTQVFPFFKIPNSAVGFVVIAFALGFPIANSDKLPERSKLRRIPAGG